MRNIPDEAAADVKKDIEDTLTAAIRVGARPLTPGEWRACLEQTGFTIEKVEHAPMHLLRPARLVADEGLWRALRFVKNVLADADARHRRCS